MKLSNRVYDVLKYIALVALPPLSVFYETIGKLWGLPYVDKIPATIMAVDTLLGALLLISTHNYNKEVQDNDASGN